MKSIRFMLVAIMAIIGTAVYGQEKTTSFKVYGNCEMCKKRIEKAANIEGVSKATWDVDSKMMTVAFDSGKVNDKDIQKRIAQIGHDTQNFSAKDVTYNKLPECCQYDRKIAANTENEEHQEQDSHQHKH
ncbi:heavy-metal-associated domain-containing protein [Olivibacter domesticus]|uniref:Copper chaperone CopZ n=1 Tax=Olivibacter domesticus TaxID=407022 RepID=A0A1H7MV68_OLID1|nr:heavy-metal-associated domain-containing protein [Olivibacter domesticus]SEL15246.1 Copper chaperone CopZ [Olivibacter domesticus]